MKLSVWLTWSRFMQTALALLMTLLALALLGAYAPTKAQQPATNLKFVLDWTPQGYHMPWILASDRGYFAHEGLNVTVDRGYGAGDVLAKVASGAYDVGLGDINDLVTWNAAHPDNKLITIFQYWDHGIAAILTLKDRHITSLKDVEGKRIAATLGDSARLMMPALAKANHFDASSIKWVTVQPALREATLIRGEADAISGFIVTRFALMKAGVPEDNIVTFNLSESMETYGLSVVTRADLVKRNPEMLRGFLRGTFLGLHDALKSPSETIDLLLKRDPLLDRKLELARFRMVIDKAILTPHVLKYGISMVEPKRLEDTVARMAAAMKIEKPGPASELYTDALLPAVAERKLPAVGQ
jgi:NitT/TauT family transport system substrate-binding protein